MALQTQDDARIDASAIDHHGEFAVVAATVATDNGDSLSSFHAIAYLNEVLCIAAVNGLESVVVTDDDDVSELWMTAR